MARSFRPMVRTGSDPKFYGNALRFATRAEALQNAQDLADRWTLVVDFNAEESDDPVKHTYIDGKLGDAPEAAA
jgi:hypothetical protein